MSAADFFTFLRASLSHLETEVPEAHRTLAGVIGQLRARLVADGDARIIQFGYAGWTIAQDGDTDLEVAFDRAIIIELVDGQLTLQDAIEQERLRLCGPIGSIERFHEALLIYLEGMIRAPTAPALLEDYLSA
jgi:hypothetical protein